MKKKKIIFLKNLNIRNYQKIIQIKQSNLICQKDIAANHLKIQVLKKNQNLLLKKRED